MSMFIYIMRRYKHLSIRIFSALLVFLGTGLLPAASVARFLQPADFPSPSLPDTLLAKAQAALDQGDATRALSLFREVLTRDPRSYAGRMGLTRTLVATDQLAEAHLLLDALHADFPADPDVRVVRGFVRLRQNHPTAAYDDFAAVTARYPDYADAWQGRGLAAWRLERYDEAAASFSAWIAKKPEVAAAYLWRARAHLELGQYERARADLDAAALRGADPEERDAIARRFPPSVRQPWLQLTTAYTRESINADLPPWHTSAIRLDLRATPLSGGLTYERTERFGRSDNTIELDTYALLWPGAYGNVRFRYTPDAHLLPAHDVLLELFQETGSGFVPAVQYHWRDYPVFDVHKASLALGRYVGAWYLRGQGEVSFLTSEWLPLGTVTARRYIGPSDTYTEARLAYGQSAILIGSGPQVEEGGTFLAALSGQTYFNDWIGAGLSLSYVQEKGIPDRFGLSVRLLTRLTR